jgi:hypothetical protein
MVTIVQKQRIWECHEFELTPEQLKEFNKLPKKDRPNFLDNIGGSGAEFEGDNFFEYEVQ